MDLELVTFVALVGLFGAVGALFALLDDWYNELLPETYD